MVVDGGGHFSPAGIDGVQTYLYYYRPLQHMAVPRVIHTQYNTPITNTKTNERGYSNLTNTREV